MSSYPLKPFHLLILERCRQFGSSMALSDGDVELTFSQVLQMTHRLANFLKEHKVTKGSSILVCLSNSHWYPILFLASALLGATISGINAQSTTNELQHFVEKSGAKWIFCQKQQVPTISAALPKITIITVDEKVKHMLTVSHGLKDYSESFPEEEVDLDSPLIMPFSSGTTGKPKCVILTHRNYLAATYSLKKALFDDLIGTRRRKTLAFLPFYHGSGFWALIFCLLEGCHTIIMPHFHPMTMLSLVSQHKIDVINVVPSILRLLCHYNHSYDVSCLKTVLSGASPLGKELSSAFLHRFPSVTNLVQGYGMTELVVLSHLTPLGTPMDHLGSCGKLLPGFEAKILSRDGAIITKPFEFGELYLKSDAIMREYKGGENNNIDEEGWLHTGDIVYFDDENFYFVVDRLKDLIKVNGLQVSPSEIEDVIESLPFVVESCVFGVPHDLHGEVPRAVVVLSPRIKDSKKSFVLEEIRDHVKDTLAPYKHLRGGIEAADELPKTNSGKVARNLIRPS